MSRNITRRIVSDEALVQLHRQDCIYASEGLYRFEQSDNAHAHEITVYMRVAAVSELLPFERFQQFDFFASVPKILGVDNWTKIVAAEIVQKSILQTRTTIPMISLFFPSQGDKTVYKGETVTYDNRMITGTITTERVYPGRQMYYHVGSNISALFFDAFDEMRNSILLTDLGGLKNGTNN